MTIRDFQHGIEVDGRVVIVQVCACGNISAPETVPGFDSIILVAAPGALADQKR